MCFEQAFNNTGCKMVSRPGMVYWSDYWVSNDIIPVRYIIVRIHMLRWIYGDTRLDKIRIITFNKSLKYHTCRTRWASPLRWFHNVQCLFSCALFLGEAIRGSKVIKERGVCLFSCALFLGVFAFMIWFNFKGWGIYDLCYGFEPRAMQTKPGI